MGYLRHLSIHDVRHITASVEELLNFLARPRQTEPNEISYPGSVPTLESRARQKRNPPVANRAWESDERGNFLRPP